MANLSAGIGQICVSGCPDDVISAVGLGSCVAVVLYDGFSDQLGVVHCMLPADKGRQADASDRPGRYVDTGVTELVRRMSVPPQRVSRLVAALVGGAAMFEFNGPSELDIGKSNITAARQILCEFQVQVLAADTGGNQGRTLKVQCDDGTVTVRTLGQERTLICLREKAARRAA
ncbi:MAG: chemotaxis protein CheD [Armatimonadota bacterium]